MQRIKIFFAVSAIFMTLALPLMSDDLAAIKKALDSKYALTTTTADHSDIVTAGSVLVLRKSNLLTREVSKPAFFANSYKNGRITQAKMIALANASGKMEGARTFVAGEKIWLTGIEVKDKEVSFILYTDAYNDVRYRAKLNFPLEKDAEPTVGGVLSAVADVFDVQASDNGGQQQTQNAPQSPAGLRPATGTSAAAIAVEAPPPPIAPPPPPPADPKEIKLGQTTDQVVANIGAPDKIVNQGAKKIYVYKDMRIVFVGGKVNDVQ